MVSGVTDPYDPFITNRKYIKMENCDEENHLNQTQALIMHRNTSKGLFSI